MAALGFKLSDIKIILNSHAHSDHAGGLAELKRMTGATFMAAAADADLLERGGKGDFNFGDRLLFPPIRVDHRLNDGDKFEVGGVTMVAHLTPGHTQGCTTWTTSVLDGGQARQVVFVGSPTVPGYQLVGNSVYPNIIADYERTFRVLKVLPCDVFLGSHGSFFSFVEKIKRMREDTKTNSFIDPEGYSRFVHENEEAFRKEVARQRSSRDQTASPPSPISSP